MGGAAPLRLYQRNIAAIIPLRSMGIYPLTGGFFPLILALFVTSPIFCREAIVVHGTVEELFPQRAHRPKHRKSDKVAILPVGDGAGRPQAVEQPDVVARTGLVPRPQLGERSDAIGRSDVAGRSYEELYVEHAPVARAVALSMVPRDVADDIVAEAFTRVLGAIRAGGGPPRGTTAVGDVEQDLDDRVPEENMGLARLSRGPEAEAEARVEAQLVAKAFAKLPERWQAVLWQLEVEARAPAAVAPAFGLSANGVSSLAVRARARLRP